jgi:hypothetical protein
MAKPKLTNEQRETLLTWLAADYDSGLIVKWFSEKEWPAIGRAALHYYREKYGILIDEIRKLRRDSAINTGLALKEERIARLAQHADILEAIKWEPDERGRLWNEKAWRETLADIAAEVGGRKQSVALTGADGGKVEIVVTYADKRDTSSTA